MSPVDRMVPPLPGAVRPFEFPPVESRALDGGLALRVARLPRLPIVAVTLVLPAGEALLDEARAGHATLTANALEGGTRRRSGIELAEALEGIGASLGASAGWDSTTVSLAALADRLEDALALLAEVVLEPAFPHEEVARIRDQQLARIRQREKDPGSLASDRAAGLIYSADSPYGRPAGGVPASVMSFHEAEAAAVAASLYKPVGGGLVVAGDVDVDAVEALARRVFAGWSGGDRQGLETLAAARFTHATVHVIDRPGAVQSEIRVGHPGIAVGHPDHHAVAVMNTVLGGAFTSRLNLNLREKNGFTYGVRSRFAMRRGAGPFTVSTAVETDVTTLAVREILAELGAMAERGPTEDEVEAARDYIAGVFPLRLETSAQVAARIAELIVYDLPDDHHARYRDQIRAVTRDDAAAAARRQVRPHEATIVVAGDAARIAKPLEALGLGSVTVHPRPE